MVENVAVILLNLVMSLTLLTAGEIAGLTARLISLDVKSFGFTDTPSLREDL